MKNVGRSNHTTLPAIEESENHACGIKGGELHRVDSCSGKRMIVQLLTSCLDTISCMESVVENNSHIGNIQVAIYVKT